MRLFGASKFARYTINDRAYSQRLRYAVNENYTTGVGLTYKHLGVSASFRIPFLKSDTARFGQTKSVDIQAAIYLRKFTMDIYYTYYKGYYLYDRDILAIPVTDNTFPRRSDMRSVSTGMTMQYIYNNKRFSFRAAFLQTEQQKKSAGSLITGAGLHFIRVMADSPIISGALRYPAYFGNNPYNKTNIATLFVNAGYAYNYIFGKHFFICGALVAGVGINHTSLSDEVTHKSEGQFAAHFDGSVKLVVGYNNRQYFAGLQYINFINRNNTPVDATWQEFQAGNIRLTLAKRFALKRKTKIAIGKIENKIRDEAGLDPVKPDLK